MELESPSAQVLLSLNDIMFFHLITLDLKRRYHCENQFSFLLKFVNYDIFKSPIKRTGNSVSHQVGFRLFPFTFSFQA